jgi:hypothetical protein
LLFIAAGSFHPDREPTNNHPAVFAEYANSACWGAVHMGQFAGISVMLAGSLTIAFALDIQAGTAVG